VGGNGMSMEGIAGYWPMMWLILRVMLAAVPVVIFLSWPVATWMRHRAYGSGGARRPPVPVSGDAWRLVPAGSFQSEGRRVADPVSDWEEPF
jgi:hypothetical protein